MKKLFLIFIILNIIGTDSFAAAKKSTSKKSAPKEEISVAAVVDYIVDGDTFAGRVLLADDVTITIRVRILDIDAPEISGQCDSEIKMAKTAKNKLAELIPTGSKVTLANVKDDKYLGRIDAIVFNSDGENIGDIMFGKGLVRKYDGGTRKGWCK